MDIYDSIIICSNEEPIILVRDCTQQIQLSHHKINKKVSDQIKEKRGFEKLNYE